MAVTGVTGVTLVTRAITDAAPVQAHLAHPGPSSTPTSINILVSPHNPQFIVGIHNGHIKGRLTILISKSDIATVRDIGPLKNSDKSDKVL